MQKVLVAKKLIASTRNKNQKLSKCYWHDAYSVPTTTPSQDEKFRTKIFKKNDDNVAK